MKYFRISNKSLNNSDMIKKKINDAIPMGNFHDNCFWTRVLIN